MSIRVVPLPSPTTAQLPECIAIPDVAKRLGKSPATIRRWIELDMQDGGRRVPGGRKGDGESLVVIRAVFERAMRDGIEPAPRPIAVSTNVTAVIAELREMAARCTAIADGLRDAQVLDRVPGRLRQTG